MRKLLGGGMRQAGVLAAAALVGLSHIVETLQRDHDNARCFAQGACSVRGGNISFLCTVKVLKLLLQPFSGAKDGRLCWYPLSSHFRRAVLALLACESPSPFLLP